MVGANLREGIVEVAFEHRIERGVYILDGTLSVDFDVIPTLHGRQYRRDPVLVECRASSSEFRW